MRPISAAVVTRQQGERASQASRLSVRRRAAWGVATVAVYGLAFSPLYSTTGPGVGALVCFPALVWAALFGLRVGLLGAVIALPVNTFMYNLVGIEGWAALFEASAIITHAVTFAVCGAVGRMCDLRSALEREIEGHRRTEATLRESETRCRWLSRANFEGVAIVEDGLIADVNDAMVRISGWSEDNLVGRPLSDLVAAESRPIIEDVIGTPAQAPRELVGLRCDGSHYPLEVASRFLRFEQRTVQVTTARDITSRKAAEAALRRSERNFRTMIERSPDAIALYRDGAFIFANHALCKFFGVKGPDALLGQSVHAFVHGDDRDSIIEGIRRIERGAATDRPVVRRFIRVDGSVRVAEVVALPLDFGGEPAVLAIGRDVTARKEMEVQLAAADRMASIGMLASSVAHEVNNPLTFVLCNLEGVVEDMLDLPDPTEDLDEETFDDFLGRLHDSIDGVKRVRDIVRSLRTLSRFEDDAPGRANINVAVHTALRMAGAELRYRARIVEALGEVPLVRGSQGRLCQVVINLLVNAAHAIPTGRPRENEVGVHTRLDGHTVVLEVRDTGRGIESDAISHIFEPFFTTKNPGDGTGLGLSICRNIVEASDGQISVRSQLGVGTCVTVALPMAAPVAPAEPISKPERAPPALPDAPKLRVLLVDDDSRVLETLQRHVLRGHDVTALDSAERARGLLADDTRFDAIVCDIMMPGTSGLDFYRDICAWKPEIATKFVFMTAGAVTPESRAFLEETAHPCLDKPFSRDELLDAIRALDALADDEPDDAETLGTPVDSG